jgi:hypothetical protein
MAACALAPLAVLSGCRGLDLLRSPGQGYVATRVCGVQIDGQRVARLRIELVPTSRLPRGAFVEAEFENPEGGAPVFAGGVFTGNQQTLEILSPPLSDVRPRNYQVVARIYASKDRKQVLGAHTQICQSLVDRRDLAPG